MWFDQRGSEVLTRDECLRLLALRSGGIGRVGLAANGQAVIVPVNYQIVDGDVVIQIGQGDMLSAASNQTIVAFEVDDVSGMAGVAWSVLVQGLAVVLTKEQVARLHPSGSPLVPEPGTSFVRIRTGVLSGRRFPVPASIAG
jgi:nitroimidazol reductase NimA-like FMN-containing flavoprotein (pyridoxamine 5'-phosphate oxidase superfamily)